MNPLEERVADRIRQRGPIPLAEVVEAALYDEGGGFYAGGGSAGRRGDFITSPEVGPLFGAVLARALDQWWDELGRPHPFVVVDAGAGRGVLAIAVLAAAPACARALRYVLVERSAALRARHGEHLPLAPASHALGGGGAGPVAVSLAELPVVAGPVVVVANELLDNLPFGLAERHAGGWYDVLVGLDAAETGFAEVLVPADPGTAALLDRVAPAAPPGARVPVQTAVVEWLRRALLRTGEAGRVVVVDYATTTADLARRPAGEWLRTYRAHQHGGAPLAGLGTQDITCEVAVDQLAQVRRPDADRTQAAFLAAHGIAELVAAGRRTWEERRAVGDLEAIRGRSRVGEAEALLDPAGLGAFRVLEWIISPSNQRFDGE